MREIVSINNLPFFCSSVDRSAANAVAKINNVTPRALCVGTRSRHIVAFRNVANCSATDDDDDNERKKEKNWNIILNDKFAAINLYVLCMRACARSRQCVLKVVSMCVAQPAMYLLFE